MLKVTGLDSLQKQLNEAQKALESLEGELGRVSFDSNDPSSIEAAIQQVCSTIDGRVGVYSSNPFISPLIEEMKENYREHILQKAAEARLKESKDE